jgi:uncharacterized protein (TIGR02117 family)
MRRFARIASWTAAVLLAIPAAYLAAAVLLGLTAINTDFRPASNGVRIWVRTNGVHAEFVVPTQAVGVDWSAEHPASDMRALAAPLAFIAFGWGDAEFFANTPTWSDLRPATAIKALTGVGEGAMHVEYVEAPGAYAGREVSLSVAQYRQLVEYIGASFARDASERPRKLPLSGYFDRDAFYAAVPRYSPVLTSNDWVRRGLAAAGVRAPRWAPFDVALFYQLDRVPAR